jgi:adenine-specific DNA-methyltransferase
MIEGTFKVREVEPFAETQNVTAYLDQMIRLLRIDGVRFPDNKQMHFTRLDPIYSATGGTPLHAEGAWQPASGGREAAEPAPSTESPAADSTPTVAVVIGPQYGPITTKQVVEAIPAAFRRGYTDLLFAGFSFDAGAYAEIDHPANPKLKLHLATIRPDVNPGMEGLLKEQPGSQLFTVFGQPRVSLAGPDKHGEYTVTMEGVDIYDPVNNVVQPTRADKVAAWFLDSDYDGRTFCITQAFFPDRGAWDKLERALNGKDGLIDEDKFSAFSGTTSLPFKPGKHEKVAVKVIDPRGNEVMWVREIEKP